MATEEESIFEEEHIIQLPSDIRDGEGNRVKLALGIGLNVIRQVPGGGGDTLSRTTSGLVFADDFDRADSDTPGNGWVEYGTDFDINTNDLLASVANGEIRACQQEGATGGEMFVQGELFGGGGGATAAGPMIAARMDALTAGNNDPNDAYLLRANLRDDEITILKFVSNSASNLDSTPKALFGGTRYPAQFYVADGVQEGWIDGTTVSGTDTAHDGQDARHAGVVGQGLGASHPHRWNDFLWCSSKSITVTGLSAGQKAKVRNSGGSVVAEATESGGTATIDASRFGGATEIAPLAGWADLIVTEPDDTLVATYDAAGVYPGDEYALS